MRTAQLPAHLHGFHPELLGSVVKSHSSLLKPVYTPFVPKLQPPPPIPSGRLCVYDYDPLPVRKANRKRKRDESPLQSPFMGPKWSRLNAQDEEDDEPEVPDLDDLPGFSPDIDEACDIIVRRKPPEATQIGLSSAHRMVNPPPPDIQPPISILYDQFARNVDDLLAKGLL